MKNKKLVIAIAALVAAVAVLLGVYMATRPETVEGSKHVTVVIVHSDGAEKTLEYDTDAEYLADLLLEKELAAGYESEYGLTIESVDGEAAVWETDSAYWALYIGEEAAITGASGIVLTDGGIYKLVYEKF